MVNLRIMVLLVAGVWLGSSPSLWAQSRIDTVKRDDGHGRVFIQVYSYQSLMEEGYTQDGVREGVWLVYWPDSYPSRIISYKEGKQDGIYMEVDPAGKIQLVEYYKDGKREGPRKRYHETQAIILESENYKAGLRHGPLIRWYENGNKKEVSEYRNGQLHGTARWYSPDEVIMAEYHYKEGQLEGPCKIYDEQGNLEEEGQYSDNEKTGVWTLYYPDGRPKARGEYDKGKKKKGWEKF